MTQWISLKKLSTMTLWLSGKKLRNSKGDWLQSSPKGLMIMIPSWENSNFWIALKEFSTGQSSKMNSKKSMQFCSICISKT